MANIENRERLKAAIMANYETLDVDVFAERRASSPCGTVGCIAGFCDWLSACDGHESTLFDIDGRVISRGMDYHMIPKSAITFLGITRDQAVMLFLPSMWPEKIYDDLYRHMPGTLEYAKVVCRRIDQVVK